MTHVSRRTALAAALSVAVFSPPALADARPALSEVPEIENALFAVAVADKVRDNCAGISARTMRALKLLRNIKQKANALGYSDDEIRAYVESDQEKARMRAKGERYLSRAGVQPGNAETLCAFGHAEIQKNSAIGALLRAR